MLCFDHHSKLVSQIHDANEETIDSGDYDIDDDHHVINSLHECRTSEGYKKLDVDADHMRRNIIDWLIGTHYGLKLRPETLYLCVNILDRFLCKTKFDKSTTKKELELVAVTSLLLASKYEQQRSLSVSALEYITQNSCSQDDIRGMEIVILSKLNWVLTVPTPYVFLPRYMRACLLYDDDKIMGNMVFFLSELSLTHYPIMSHYMPSLIAASAVYCARIIVGRFPFWNKNLKNCSGYSKKKLSSCAKLMLELCRETCRDGNMEVFKKFSSPNHFKVAYFAQQKLATIILILKFLSIYKGQPHLLDMAKAYDRVEWSFLEDVLIYMRFQEEWFHSSCRVSHLYLSQSR